MSSEWNSARHISGHILDDVSKRRIEGAARNIVGRVKVEAGVARLTREMQANVKRFLEQIYVAAPHHAYAAVLPCQLPFALRAAHARGWRILASA